MFLEIGNCARREGWTTLDIDGDPDIKANAFEPLPLQDSSVDELYSSHVIEHTGWNTVKDVLKEWGRVVKPGGVMHLKCPDFAYHVKRYQSDPAMLYAEGGLMYGLYGQQDPAPMRHRAALDRRWLETFLIEAGFEPMEWNESNLWELNVRAKKL